MEYSNDTWERLLLIMEQLRDPSSGCPWDRAQTFPTIVPHTLEEAYEVADAIERRDMKHLPEELGDLLFQIIFYAQLGKEQQLFEMQTILEHLESKLIRRHPHVFETSNSTKEDVLKHSQTWEQKKLKERNDENCSILSDVPRALPALSRSQKLQKRAATVGFDWQNIQQVMAKVHEELQEVKIEIEQQDQHALHEEIGDLLFTVVNLARFAGFDAEQTLRASNDKFTRRFNDVELAVKASQKDFAEHSQEELEHYWSQAKKKEKEI